MIITAIRSFFFSLFYFTWTIFFSLFFLWTLLLPQKTFRKIMPLYYKGIYLIEIIFLDLKYEIRGLENIPKDRNFIVASKHQSAYETFKYFLIFDDMVFILKKELMQIPIWGWYPWKMGFIGINRGKGRAAKKSLEIAIKTLKASDKNLLIFPQGTRVPTEATTKDYPYKAGISRIYKQSDMPVLPVAINAGYYWPKHSFIKKSGTVIFEILPIIEAGLDSNDFMNKLENELETASNRLLKLAAS